jgi:hypothetical protein
VYHHWAKENKMDETSIVKDEYNCCLAQKRKMDPDTQEKKVQLAILGEARKMAFSTLPEAEQTKWAELSKVALVEDKWV